MPNLVNSLSLVLSVFIVALFSRCHKDAGTIEKRLVATTIIRSIPTDFDIVEFSLVSADICFAIGVKDNLYKIFRTIDGGRHWDLTYTSAFNDLEIQSIVFVDEFNGIIVFNNHAYRTYDGGATWSTNYINILPPPGESYAYDFIYAGKTAANEFLLVESNGNSWIDNRIFTSSPFSSNYSMIASFEHDGDRHDYGHYCNGKLFYLARDFNYWDEKVYMYDLATQVMDTLDVPGSYGTAVLDAMYADERVVLVRESGKLQFYDGNWEKDYYNFHGEDYYSVDFIDPYFVAVANKSITSNYAGVWEEAIKPDGSGFKENFMKVVKIDQTSFYISGANGVFLKATFQ